MTPPAATLVKHLKSSQNRIERMARDAEYFRTGLRQIESDAMTLRNVLEDKPEGLLDIAAGKMSRDARFF